MRYLLIFTILLAFAAQANAGCWLEGFEYPAGTIKGSMICGSDGYWRPRQ